MTLQVWNFDPGLMTGWSILNIFDNRFGNFNYGQTHHVEIGNLLLKNSTMYSALNNPGIEVVFTAEKFTMSPGKTQQPWSLETTGLIRYAADSYGVPFFQYRPSECKPLIKDDVLKRNDLWVAGKNHAMDSVRVGLYYLVKERKMNWILSKPKDTETKSG
jgi:hypothetical protein